MMKKAQTPDAKDGRQCNKPKKRDWCAHFPKKKFMNHDALCRCRNEVIPSKWQMTNEGKMCELKTKKVNST